MNLIECGKVVAKIKLGDSRDTSDAVILDWYDTIGFLDFQDAIAAVTLHRQESIEYLQAAHIIRGARRVKQERLSKQGDDYCPSHAWWPMPCDKCKQIAAE